MTRVSSAKVFVRKSLFRKRFCRRRFFCFFPSGIWTLTSLQPFSTPTTDLIEDIMEVFMDDFSVYGSSFSVYLSNLCRVLKRCEEKHLVLNWEKCHFKFDFDSKCLAAFHTIKGAQVSAPIVQPPEWDLPFEIKTE